MVVGLSRSAIVEPSMDGGVDSGSYARSRCTGHARAGGTESGQLAAKSPFCRHPGRRGSRLDFRRPRSIAAAGRMLLHRRVNECIAPCGTGPGTQTDAVYMAESDLSSIAFRHSGATRTGSSQAFRTAGGKRDPPTIHRIFASPDDSAMRVQDGRRGHPKSETIRGICHPSPVPARRHRAPASGSNDGAHLTTRTVQGRSTRLLPGTGH